MSHVVHLARRFTGSLGRRRPDPGFAARVLRPAELELWLRFDPADQRHSFIVAERLLARHPEAPDVEVAAALLHDVGKLDAGLGTMRRVGAALFAADDRTRRHRDHERLGAALLRSVGSDARLVDIVAGVASPARSRLETADDV